MKVKEDLMIDVVERVFEDRSKLRVVIGAHPISGRPSSFVPYLDLAKALTCPEQTIYSIISRTERVQKYSTTFIMKTEAGLRPTLCITEEGLLHAIMKLQPSRCQDLKVGERLDEIQDELIQLLRDALHGYTGKADKACVGTAKVICQLISVANKTKNLDYLNILNSQIEAMSGVKLVKEEQLELSLQVFDGAET